MNVHDYIYIYTYVHIHIYWNPRGVSSPVNLNVAGESNVGRYSQLCSNHPSNHPSSSHQNTHPKPSDLSDLSDLPKKTQKTPATFKKQQSVRVCKETGQWSFDGPIGRRLIRVSESSKKAVSKKHPRTMPIPHLQEFLAQVRRP